MEATIKYAAENFSPEFVLLSGDYIGRSLKKLQTKDLFNSLLLNKKKILYGTKKKARS